MPCDESNLPFCRLRSWNSTSIANRRRWGNPIRDRLLLTLDLARNAPRHVHLLIPFFFASRLGPILTE